MALKSRGEKRSVEISQHSQSQPSGAQLFGVSEAICPGVLPQSPLHIQPFTSVWMRGFHGSPPRGASVGLPDGGAPEERNMDMAHALFCCWKCDCHPVALRTAKSCGDLGHWCRQEWGVASGYSCTSNY